MKRIFLYPYNAFSGGAKALARALQARRIRLNGSRYRPRDNHLIINWGNTRCPFPCLNDPVAVRIASDKLLSYARFQEAGIPHPEWTTDQHVAFSWCKGGNRKVAGFARTTLNGHSGAGIVPFYHGTEYSIEGDVFPTGLVYTKYIPKRKEFRVHVFKGEVIDVQEKRKRSDYEGEFDSTIRTHNAGWVYCREDVTISTGGKELALQCVHAVGLDFGAVDIIWNERADQYYVLEVNTAPGIEGTTLSRYVDAFNSLKEVA